MPEGGQDRVEGSHLYSHNLFLWFLSWQLLLFYYRFRRQEPLLLVIYLRF